MEEDDAVGAMDDDLFGDDMDAGGPAGGGDDALLPENDGDQEDVEYVVGAGGRLKRKRPRKRAKRAAAPRARRSTAGKRRSEEGHDDIVVGQEGDAYDSDDAQEMAVDREFIDNTNDDAQLLAEYKKENQRFKEGPRDRDFDRGLEARPRKKDAGKETDREREDRASQFVADLERAYDEDRQMRMIKQPAVNVMRMSRELETALREDSFAIACLRNHLLRVLTLWIRPPRGGLPTQAVRTAVIRSLARMRDLIDIEHLKGSRGLGKILVYLARHPQETPPNRRALLDLLQSWARAIMSQSGSTLEEGEGAAQFGAAASQGDAGPSRRSAAAAVAAAALGPASQQQRREQEANTMGHIARRPTSLAMDYQKNVSSTFDEEVASAVKRNARARKQSQRMRGKARSR